MNLESYRVSSHFGMNYPHNEYLKQLRNSQRTVDIVCGELHPVFYDSKKFVEFLFEYITSYKTERLEIIFNGKDKNKLEAIKNLQTENLNLLHMIKEFNQVQQDKIKFNWCPIRPEKHYTIIDLKNLLIEENHDMDKPRDLYCFIEDTEVAEEWYDAFKKTKKYCEPIKIQEIIKDIK